jgi:hypothetical protein
VLSRQHLSVNKIKSDRIIRQTTVSEYGKRSYRRHRWRLAEPAGAMKVAGGLEPGASIVPLIDIKAVEKSKRTLPTWSTKVQRW